MAYALSLVGRALVTASTESSRTSNLADVCRRRPDDGLGHAGEMSVEMRWRAAFGIVGNIIAAIYDGSLRLHLYVQLYEYVQGPKK